MFIASSSSDGESHLKSGEFGVGLRIQDIESAWPLESTIGVTSMSHGIMASLPSVLPARPAVQDGATFI